MVFLAIEIAMNLNKCEIMLARKIYPFGTGVSPSDTTNIILLAEGFTAGQELMFYNHCLELVNKLINSSPFQYTQIKPHWLSIYIHFKSSNQSGPSLSTASSPQSTAYESMLTPATEQLRLNHDLIAAELNTLTVKDQANTINLSDLLVKGKKIGENGNSLIAVLVPSSGSGGDFEFTSPNANQYAYVATTLDGFWHQVVVRALGKLLKLGDEYDIEGTSNLSPSDTQGDQIHSDYPNLIYSKTNISGVPDSAFKWFNLLSASERLQPLTVHSATGVNVDRNIINPMYTYDNLELWEGAGTYRKNIYRSSQDCLMRRKTGDISIPIRKQELAFCRICQDYLFKKI